MMKEYLKHISTPQTADLLKKPKKLTIDKWGKAHSKDKNDYDFNGKLINGGKLYEEQEKQSETSRGIQVALNQIGQRDRQGKELKTDGVFGPITQAAYNDYWQKTYPKETNHLQDIYKPIMAKTVTANIFDKGATQGNAKLDKGFINTTIKADPFVYKRPKNGIVQPSKAITYPNILPSKHGRQQINNPANEIFNEGFTFYNKGTELGELGQSLSFPMHEQFNEKSLKKSSSAASPHIPNSQELKKRLAMPKPVLENILAPDKVGNYSTQEVDDYLKKLFKDDEWAKYGMDQKFWEKEAMWAESIWKIVSETPIDKLQIPEAKIMKKLIKYANNQLDKNNIKIPERVKALEDPIAATLYWTKGLDSKAAQVRDKLYKDAYGDDTNYDGALPNAFLHTYWNALQAYYGTVESAEKFSTAHEVQGTEKIKNGILDSVANVGRDNFTLEQQLWMDMHNNEVGRGLGEKVKGKNIHKELLKYYNNSEKELKEMRERDYPGFEDVELLLILYAAESVKNGEAMSLIQ